MIFNMSGGGDALNFKLVGNPQPASPKDNTIWINTDTPISSYYFGDEKALELTLAIQHDGKYAMINGTIVEDPNYVIKIFHIPTGAQKVWIRIDNYSASNAAHGFVDKDGAVISFFPRQAGYSLIDVPDNAVYVSLSVRNTETASALDDVNLEEGMVWISTGTYSTVTFNALKKNAIMVYPLSAKQLINGAWVRKTAKTYQNGAWVDWWNGELYDSGNEYTAVTGGWVAEGKRWDSTTGGNGTPKLTKNATSMTLDRVGAPSPCIFYVKNKINLTDYKTLNYKGTLSTENIAWWHQLMVWSDFGTNASDNVVASTDLKGSGTATKSIDVSHLEGEYYIGIFVYTKPALTMYKMWLE